MQWKINKINVVSRSPSGKIKVKQWKRNTTHNYTTYNTELNNIQRNTWTVSTHFLYHLFKGRQLYQREITPLAQRHNAPNWTLNINVILFLLLAISCIFFSKLLLKLHQPVLLLCLTYSITNLMNYTTVKNHLT